MLRAAPGLTADGDPFKATVERIARYREATADFPTENAGESLRVAPAMFASVASISSHRNLLRRMMPDDVIQRSIVHLSQAISFERLVAADERLDSRAEVASLHVNPVGTTIAVRFDVRDSAGVTVCEGTTGILLRGVQSNAPAEPPARADRRGRRTTAAQLGEVTFALSPDQSILYAEASGDDVPLHVDVDAARRAGFPGLILHGMCTYAMCASAIARVVAGGNHARLASLSVVFARPVLVGQPLRVIVERHGDGAIGFTARQARPVTRDGRAVLRMTSP